VAAGRPTITWQEGLVAALAIVLALSGAVTALIRSSESNTSSSDITSALNGLSSLTTVASPPSTEAPFVAQDAGFSAVFPTTPKRQQQQTATAGVSLPVIIYIAVTSDEAVGAGSATMPYTPAGKTLQAGLDGAIDGSARNYNGTVVTRTTTTFVGEPTEDAVIATPASGVVHERVLFHQRRLFVLLGITEKSDTPHAGYDRMLATFQPL
jgi:hypothetical protein